jgi:ERF superfamily protein
MQTSENINELAAALSKAQGEITGALKDSANPFFKSKYADLASCWDACREPLSKNGLSVVQTTMRGEPVTIRWETTDQESGEVRQFSVDTVETVIVTLLMHASGQWIRSSLPMIPRDASPQGVGSAITYGRRYGLTAMIGVAQVDDDGNQASGRATPHEIKGNSITRVPVDTARSHALKMMAIIDSPAKDGDHDETQKALEALDYHHKYLATNHDLYIAAAEQMQVAKRNIWKALINKAKTAEAMDKAVSGVRTKF